MLPEIALLNENLGTAKRGEAVTSIKRKLNAYIESQDWDTAIDFLREYSEVFSSHPTVLNIISTEFSILIDRLLSLASDFQAVMKLDYFSSMPWFEGIQESTLKRGKIAEWMADFGQGITSIAKLQEARKHYRRVHAIEDEKRVQHQLSELVKKNVWSSGPVMRPDNPIYQKLLGHTQEAFNVWKEADNRTKMNMLVHDFAGISPDPYTPDSQPTGDIFLSGILEEAGVIKTVGLSPEDGRVNAGPMASSRERIHSDATDAIIHCFLRQFSEPVVEWLHENERDSGVYQIIGGTLKQHLDWDENATGLFMEGLTAWMGKYPHVALSFWLPFFENALRMRLAALGEDVVSRKERTGIEDYIVFDTLLKKALNHYPDRTVAFWRKIFTTTNGLGWNLRNSFCHGILPYVAMKNPVYSLAVFISICFLISKKSEDNANA
jgi:hypothetical protein